MIAPPSTSAATLGDMRRLRAFLADAGFTANAVQRLLHVEDEPLASTTDLPVHLRRVAAEPSTLATLAQLFVLGTGVPRDVADRDLAPLGLEVWARLGLVALDGEVTPLVRLVPYEELVIASDLPPGERTDHVPGVHAPSVTLANLTPRERAERGLDVGTGNGIQALLLAAHVERVVATDVNERALAFAAFNAVLNSIDNVELRGGSFLEPVAGESFDVVVANPPYVISPESEYLFRDSGLGRDRVSENLVRSLPSVLAEGAFATVMVSWIQDGEDVAQRPRAWLEDTGCDAVILHSASDDALASAAGWNRDAPSDDEYAERVHRWADYYRDEGIEALGYGAILLRRRAAENWVRTLELPPGRVPPAGGHVSRLFASRDFLDTEPPLLERRFAFVPEARLEQHLKPADDGWHGSEAAIVLEEGLRFRVGLDANATRIVASIEPSRPLAEILDAVATALAADPEAVRAGGADLVRRLLELGFLVPA